MIKRFDTFNKINEEMATMSFNTKFIDKSIENIERELKFAKEETENIEANYNDNDKLNNDQIDDIILYYKSNIENLQKTLDNLIKIRDLVKNYTENGSQYLF